jgi:hypothetical protein
MAKKSSPTVFFLAVLILIASVTHSASADEIYGSWADSDTGMRIDILDGFKPGQGAVLSVGSDSKVKSGSWTNVDGKITLNIGWKSYDVSMPEGDRLLLGQTYGKSVLLSRLGTEEIAETVSLKEDSTAFIDLLNSKVWITSLDGRNAVFKRTFSPDAGVLELSKDDVLEGLQSWSVASGVLKLESTLLIEARINDRFFVGLDKNDNFVVFRAIEDAPEVVSTDLKREREEFFNALLTGEWETSSGSRLKTTRFRPVFGELAGKKITTTRGRLTSQSDWEYSPSTGAIKIGYSKYNGAVIVNDTIALLKENGDQEFYRRAPASSDKRYTLADLKQTALNENSKAKVQSMLGYQVYRDNFLYSWEFDSEGRAGYLHKWVSTPFVIAGETMETEGAGKRNVLRQVEEFLIFDDKEVYQLDSTVSRLRPKSDTEAAADAAAAQGAIDNAMQKKLMLRLLTKDGRTVDVALPVSSFSDIGSMSIVAE